jgi:hypothetical protein
MTETRFDMHPQLPRGTIVEWVDIGNAIAFADQAFEGNGEMVVRQLLEDRTVLWRADEVDVDDEGCIVEMRRVQVDMVGFRKWLHVS